MGWGGFGYTSIRSVIDESESQTNPIPYSHMTVDNDPIVETVRLPIYGRASHLLTCWGSRISRKPEV
jgi:hypothetical protein